MLVAGGGDESVGTGFFRVGWAVPGEAALLPFRDDGFLLFRREVQWVYMAGSGKLLSGILRLGRAGASLGS